MTSQTLRAQPTMRARSPALDTITPNFTDPSFDPVDFLNDTLPPLTVASSSSSSPSQIFSQAQPGSLSLAELSAQVQSLLSQISSLNVRHANNLNGYTDDILRSGGRLAYEVEVLRGEAVGLSDSLADVLHDDIVKFVPEGLETAATTEEEKDMNDRLLSNGESSSTDPEYITKLRTLTQVRARLEDVIRTFGEAMDWPLAPSESSITSASFISVSAPETSLDSQIQEKKGQEAAKRIREGVVELLNGEGGIEAANRRVDSLRALSTLWRRTTEERPRNKFVDSLARIVEDRRRAVESQANKSSSNANQPAGMNGNSGNNGHGGEQHGENEGGGGGFLWNLQRLREEIYLE